MSFFLLLISNSKGYTKLNGDAALAFPQIVFLSKSSGVCLGGSYQLTKVKKGLKKFSLAQNSVMHAYIPKI